ncbi:MAG: IspD/TarI family cytidylyltransferase [Acidothermaceae bacterium]
MKLTGAKVAAVVLASGGGTRFGGLHNKVYLPLAGRRVVSWSLTAISRVPGIARIVLTVRPEDRELAVEILDREVPDATVTIIDGGDTRHASEYNALRHLEADVRRGDIDIVVIHDGARPLIAPSLICQLIDVARAVGGAVPGLPISDVAEVDGNALIRDRFKETALVRVQTPQAFDAQLLLAAYTSAAAEGFTGSDTSSCIERFTDAVVKHVPGDERNVKLTYPQDLFLAEQILAASGYSLK